jgi:lincosamide nucleotidyltransferase A/C/D/E
MISAEEVISIYQYLVDNNFNVWLQGGWGIDALLGEQTRPHKDLDLLILFDDVGRLRRLLESDGYSLKEIWSENRWVIDKRGVETATAFVLRDREDRELDLHAVFLNDRGDGIPAWQADEGFIYTKQDLAGDGIITGFVVQCITPEKQMVCHKGYELPEKQVKDLELLHEKFGIDY